jgi:hypothetical protein
MNYYYYKFKFKLLKTILLTFNIYFISMNHQ